MMREALNEAEQSIGEMRDLTDSAVVGGAFTQDALPAGDGKMPGIELLNDVDLHVMIELGRTEMLVEDVLRLGTGSVVELDKLAGDPVEVYVNQRLIARGEVLVFNDNFCIRVSEIVDNLQERAEEAAEQHEVAVDRG